jgi:hypothetical protein
LFSRSTPARNTGVRAQSLRLTLVSTIWSKSTGPVSGSVSLIDYSALTRGFSASKRLYSTEKRSRMQSCTGHSAIEASESIFSNLCKR